jgi:hypothetical protein
LRASNTTNNLQGVDRDDAVRGAFSPSYTGLPMVNTPPPEFSNNITQYSNKIENVFNTLDQENVNVI